MVLYSGNINLQLFFMKIEQGPLSGDKMKEEPPERTLAREREERWYRDRENLFAEESLRRKRIDSFVRNVRAAQSDEEALKFFRLPPDADTLSPEEFKQSLDDPEKFEKRKAKEKRERQEKLRDKNLILAKKIRRPKDDDELVAALLESNEEFEKKPNLPDLQGECRLRQQQNPDSTKAPLPALENLTISQYRRYALLRALYWVIGRKEREVIKAVLLIGSTARGDAKEESEIELFVATNAEQTLEADLASEITFFIKEVMPSVKVQIHQGYVATGTSAAEFLTRGSHQHPGESAVWKFLYSQSGEAQADIDSILKQSQDHQRET